MMKFKITGITPMGAVRTTQRGKYKDESARRYANYKRYIAISVKTQHLSIDPTLAACGVNIRFIMPIPKSKQGKGLEGQPHTVKPDLDNLIKGVFDAINGIVWKDDNQVINIYAEKVYESENDKPGIVFDVTELF